MSNHQLIIADENIRTILGWDGTLLYTSGVPYFWWTFFDISFSINNAIDYYLNTNVSADGTGLTSLGCYLEDGSQDCFKACADPTIFFADLATLWNCLTIGVAAQSAQDYFVNVTYADADQILKIGDLEAWNGSSILQQLFDCYNASCANTTLSFNCAYYKIPDVRSLVSVYSGDEGLYHCCDGAPVIPNADLAGPGVSIALLIEMFISA